MFRIGINRGADAVPLTYRLPWAYFADQGIVFLKFGGFQRTLRFRGGDAATLDESELEAAMERLHDALRRVRGQMSLHIEARRVPAPPYPGSDLPDAKRRAEWPDPISFLFDEERRDAYEAVDSGTGHFETERYLTFVWKCATATTLRARSLFVTSSGRKTARQGDREMHDFIAASDTAKGMLDGVMKECVWLDDEETLDFLHGTVSVNPHRAKPSYGKAKIADDIADCRVVGGVEPMLGNHFMRVISVKNSPATIPAALASLDTLPFPYRYTVRWMGMEHGEGLRHIQRQLRDWKMLGYAMIPMIIAYLAKSNTQKENEANNAMVKDAREAILVAAEDEMTIGQANLSVVLTDPDPVVLEQRVQVVTDIMQRLGLTVTSYAVAPLDTWLGTLHGHIYADLRRPVRTSVNLAHFIPWSSVWSGQNTNAYLKGAPPLMIASADGSTPFRLNLHTQGDLGHTLVLGPSGNGKTTWLNAACAGWRRYPRSKICIFTIKGGAEIMTRLLGGVTYDVGEIKPGSIGFQPLAHADEPNERVELLDWVIGLLRDQMVEINTEVRAEVAAALDLIAANPPDRRTLTHLSGYLATPALKRAIQHYSLQGGNYGRLLDDDGDRIALSTVISFDMTELLKKKAIAPHVLAHLFRYVERRIFTGDPVMLVVDEAWRFLGDALFSAKFEEWLRAARSRNVVVVFATQNMKDAFDDKIGQVLADAENVPNIILLPNHRAASAKGRELYEKLGFNAADIEIVAGAVPKKHYYFTCPQGRRLFELQLGPLGRVLCASTSTEDLIEARDIHRVAVANTDPKHRAAAFADHYLRRKELAWAADFLESDRRTAEALIQEQQEDPLAEAAE